MGLKKKVYKILLLVIKARVLASLEAKDPINRQGNDGVNESTTADLAKES
jgi:hypothetical protein